MFLINVAEPRVVGAFNLPSGSAPPLDKARGLPCCGQTGVRGQGIHHSKGDRVSINVELHPMLSRRQTERA